MDYDTIDDIYLAGKNPEYDAAAKKLLSSKKILAWILKYCVEEFKDSSIADIRDRYIIGIPETASVPVLPDETNAAAMMGTDRISGERTEDTTVTEGKVTFDVRFRAITPHNELVQLIINIEAQRSRRTSYPLLKRAMYYVSRLISSQYGVDFDKAQYGKSKRFTASGSAWMPRMKKAALPATACRRNRNTEMSGQTRKTTTCSRWSWSMWPTPGRIWKTAC